jgi:putative ABC transport system permease protein
MLTLAVGIATTTTIFAIVDEVALKPARRANDPQVFALDAGGNGVQILDYELLLANPPAGIAAIAAYDMYGGGVAQIPGRAERVLGWRVTGQYAKVHNVRAQVGRWIDDNDNAGGDLDPTVTSGGVTRPLVRGSLGANVAVISNRLWREWFDSDRGVVEHETITIEQQPARIVGVAPPDFEPSIDVWRPFGHRRLLTREELEATRPKRNPLLRTPPPVFEPIQPSLSVLTRTEGNATHGEMNGRMNSVVASRQASIESPRTRLALRPRSGDTRLVSTGYIILGFAALVFVGACANLGNMLYARAMEREGEMATRLALGATSLDVFRALSCETLLICAAASVTGLAMAAGALELFADAVPAFHTSYWRTVRLDLHVDLRLAGFAASAGALAALVVGAGSLWRSSRSSLLTRIAASGPAVLAKTEKRTLRTMLVAVQVSAAVLLQISVGMLLENTSRQLDRRILFNTSALVTARIELPDSYDESRGTHFFNQLLERVRAIDGVTAAALADALPAGEAPSPRHGLGSIIGEPRAQALSGIPTKLDGHWVFASPDFAQTLGLTVTKGRDIQVTDVAGSTPVAVITESTAHRLWPNSEAVGKRLTCCGNTYFRTVVGVVSDPVGSLGTSMAMDVASAMAQQNAGGLGVYAILPAAQHYRAEMLVVIRSTAPDTAVPRLRQAVIALNPSVPLFNAGPAHATQFVRASGERAVRTLAGALGLVAFSIAVFGVFAVVSYFVSRRTREFGLRLALGATRAQVTKLVVDHSIHMVLIGLLPGVLFASLGTRYFQVELQKLRPNGLTMWIAVPLVMLTAGVVAAWMPARRAAKVDPYAALKDH